MVSAPSVRFSSRCVRPQCHDHPVNANGAAAYIAAVRWQIAKTMPDWPHEYTVKSWEPELAAKFEGFCRYIETHGTVEPWPPPPAQPIYHNRYLVVGGHKYWAMGPQGYSDAVHHKTVINRQSCHHPGRECDRA